MFNFNPLWKTLIDKNMKKTELKEKAKFANATLATMGKNQYVSMNVLDRICEALDCKIEEVIEYKRKEN